MPGVPQVLSLRIKHNKRRVRLHKIRFRIKPCLSGSAPAHHDGEQVAAVPPAVIADTHVGRHNLVGSKIFLAVLLVDRPCVAPCGRTVFLAPPVVPACGHINANPHPVYQQENEDSP